METKRDKQAIDVNIRWMIRRDMPQILGIEKRSFKSPWKESDFLDCLRKRNCIGMVAQASRYCDQNPGEQIFGFIIYELEKHSMHVLSLAIDPDYIRQGIGKAFIEKLKTKLQQQRREAISAMIRERNLPAQLFFKSQGFQAIGVHRDYYEDTKEDAYEFVFELEGAG